MPTIPTDVVSDLLRCLGEELVLPRFRRLEADHVSEKGHGDLVTVVDREVEAALERELPGLVAGSHVVGEERVTGDAAALAELGSGWAWIVDPIDGTANFVEGRPTFGIMVGLLRQGEVLAGWIHCPALDRTAVAEAGAGAYLDGRPVRIAPSGGSPPSRDMASTRYLPPRLEREWADRDLEPRFESGFGASAIDYPAVVTGHWASLFFWRTHPWDHVPGTLLVREAGGRAARLDGTPYSPIDGRSGLLVAASEPEWDRVRGVLPG